MAKTRITIVDVPGVSTKNINVEVVGSFGLWTSGKKVEIYHIKTGCRVPCPKEMPADRFVRILNAQTKFVAVLDGMTFGQSAKGTKLDEVFKALVQRIRETAK